MAVEFIKYNDVFFQDWNKKIDNFEQWKHVKSELICGVTGRPIPKVSVCIPTYRGSARVIKEAIESVLAQEDFDDYDIIVSDNYSPGDPELEALMRDFCNKHDNIRYYRTDYDFGIFANWNRAIELAESKWVCSLQHDDTMCPDYLKKAYECAEKYNATLVGVFRNMICEKDGVDRGFVKSMSGSQKILSILRRKRPFHVIPSDALRIITPATGCLFYKRSVYMDIGGYNPKFEDPTDGFCHFNQAYNGKVVILPEFLYNRRISSNFSFKESAQSKIISMLYGFGRYFIKTEGSIKNKRRAGLILEISISYMVYGIKSKYIPSLNVKEMLFKMGIRKSIVKMHPKILALLNCFLLTDLIFRK